MSHLALGLVLGSALFHAVWNLLLKGQTGKLTFMAAALLCGLVVFAVPAAVALHAGGLPPVAIPWAVASGLIHVAYFTFLTLAYDSGDLSFAYPIARGGAALLVPLLGWALLAERPDIQGASGIVLILAGLLVLQYGDLRHGGSRRSALWAIATAVAIAGYSLVDKRGVGYAQPLAYWYVGALVAVIAMVPVLALRGELAALRPGAAATSGAVHWPSAAAVGTLLFVTYLIVLYALRLAPVIYVYPARQASLAFAVLLGAFVQREPALARRLTGALIVAIGTVLLGAA